MTFTYRNAKIYRVLYYTKLTHGSYGRSRSVFGLSHIERGLGTRKFFIAVGYKNGIEFEIHLRFKRITNVSQT